MFSVLKRSVLEAILSGEENGILIFVVDTRSTGGADFVSRHAAMNNTPTPNARNVGYAGKRCAVFAVRCSAWVEGDSTTSTFRYCHQLVRVRVIKLWLTALEVGLRANTLPGAFVPPQHSAGLIT